MNDQPEKPLDGGQENVEKPKERPEILPLPPPPPLPSVLPQADSDGTEPPDFVPFRPPRREHFMPWLALLSSQKIPYRIEFQDAEAWIQVPWEWAERAEQEFSLYEARHLDWPPKTDAVEEKPEEVRPLVSDEAFCVFLLFFALLFRFYLWVGGSRDGMNNWHESGIWDNALVRSGEWWRSLTALTLHADAPHALNNVFWGFALGCLVGTEVGAGVGLLTMTMSGFLGNGLMALIGLEGHRALGASTMVFGLLGALGALHTRRAWRRHRQIPGGPIVKLIPWIPLLSMVAMLNLYGTGPGTDLMGHALGFAMGALIGVALPTDDRRLSSWTVQIGAGLLAVGLFVLSWTLALSR
ncbi:MAG: rhomboid family intramembrane serine protease [Victivallales bacterium]|nr:rhomboid family intramembrane serine protease [Victivallales bacterium]